MSAAARAEAQQWQVTPETARFLQHFAYVATGRHHKFSDVRPFFCQVEAVETAIWLTEVASQSRNGKRLLDLLVAANKDANPELMRLALDATPSDEDDPLRAAALIGVALALDGGRSLQVRAA
jgi:hypothetical protein